MNGKTLWRLAFPKPAKSHSHATRPAGLFQPWPDGERKQPFQHEFRQQILRKAARHVVGSQDVQAQPVGVGEMLWQPLAMAAMAKVARCR
jgi:hypothetical protein